MPVQVLVSSLVGAADEDKNSCVRRRPFSQEDVLAPLAVQHYHGWGVVDKRFIDISATGDWQGDGGTKERGSYASVLVSQCSLDGQSYSPEMAASPNKNHLDALRLQGATDGSLPSARVVIFRIYNTAAGVMPILVKDGAWGSVDIMSVIGKNWGSSAEIWSATDKHKWMIHRLRITGCRDCRFALYGRFPRVTEYGNINTTITPMPGCVIEKHEKH